MCVCVCGGGVCVCVVVVVCVCVVVCVSVWLCSCGCVYVGYWSVKKQLLHFFIYVRFPNTFITTKPLLLVKEF